MTRWRKEVRKKMDALYRQEQAEYEMGCGFGVSEICSVFEPYWEKLNEEMAQTYGKTVEEYEVMLYEAQNDLYFAGAIPFC